ncbi:GNAT family N-acetyltransferase [Nocardia altamirensis]|uniref:GNAT family N-acetyltransferase n=1 Tax=Nocardia altamirensis TaxID=472158 RepID=UPI0009FF8116|nr:GNAT family protein [Nocardia altamirensis]
MTTRPNSLVRIELGPVSLRGRSVVLRPPHYADYHHWRRIRLRDQRFIEPFWYSSTLDWTARHSGTHWVRECLTGRAEARAGRRLATVIEVDGRFAGQVELGSIDRAAGAAELGIWIDAELARHGIGGMAAALLLDFGFDRIGLSRITAPISPDNVAAARGAAEIGFRREALMGRYFDVGGGRRDHDLWALTTADRPQAGFVRFWLDRYDTADPGAAPAPPDEATGASLSTLTLLLATARYYTGRLIHLFDPLRRPRSVRLADPDHPTVVLRTRRFGDWRRWRVARVGAHAALAPEADAATWARQHSFPQWVRQFLCSRPGLRSAGGLVLVIEVAGVYSGEAKLFDLDMFDRNARMLVWTDPTHPDLLRTTATRLLLTHAFGPLGLRRVATAISPDDQRSAEIATHAGMVCEGRMRAYLAPTGHRTDHDLWAITTPAPPEQSADSPTPLSEVE